MAATAPTRQLRRASPSGIHSHICQTIYCVSLQKHCFVLDSPPPFPLAPYFICSRFRFPVLNPWRATGVQWRPLLSQVIVFQHNDVDVLCETLLLVSFGAEQCVGCYSNISSHLSFKCQRNRKGRGVQKYNPAHLHLTVIFSNWAANSAFNTSKTQIVLSKKSLRNNFILNCAFKLFFPIIYSVLFDNSFRQL